MPGSAPSHGTNLVILVDIPHKSKKAHYRTNMGISQAQQLLLFGNIKINGLNSNIFLHTH